MDGTPNIVKDAGGIGSAIGPIIRTLNTPGTGGWSNYQVIEVPVVLLAVSPSETVCFVFKGGFGVGNFHWFTFERLAP